MRLSTFADISLPQAMQVCAAHLALRFVATSRTVQQMQGAHFTLLVALHRLHGVHICLTGGYVEAAQPCDPGMCECAPAAF